MTEESKRGIKWGDDLKDVKGIHEEEMEEERNEKEDDETREMEEKGKGGMRSAGRR